VKSAAPALALVVLAAACHRAPSPPDSATEHARRTADEIAARYGVAAVPPDGLDVVTDFSHVRIHDVGVQRSLFFVRDDGTHALQSLVNLATPHLLLTPYARTMFASYLFEPAPERVLIVGLGGGAMVRFLEHEDAALRIDAVDIDPQIVTIAERYFGTRPSDRVRLMVADGYDLIRSSTEVYDVIYMDAFLRPSDETDQAGNPLRLKEAPFYTALRARLSPGGVVAFNLNPQPERERDIDELRSAFPQVYVWSVEVDLNWIAVATQEPRRSTEAELRARAAELEAAPGALPFSSMIDRLLPAPAGQGSGAS
jgi:spermidine synthase